MPDPRTCLLLLSSVADQLGWRMAQVALPLVVLRQTGSIWSTGLVGAAAGLPVLASPLWTRRLRQWAAEPSRVAALHALAAVAALTPPLAARAHQLTPALLVMTGLVLGTATTLTGPARSALLADAGSDGQGGAARVLAWQEAGMRLALVVGPAAAGVIIGEFGAVAALAAEALGYGLAAALAWAASAFAATSRGPDAGPRSATDRRAAPTLRQSMRGQRLVLTGLLIRGVGCLGWFAFSLGLPLLDGSPGRMSLAALGFSSYGLAGLVGSALAVRTVAARDPLLLAAAGWALGGLSFILIGTWPSAAGVVSGAAVAGLAVPSGNAAVTAALTRSTKGPALRAALAGQQLVVSATSTAGLLAGAPLIGAVGAPAALVAAGSVTAVVAAGLAMLSSKRSAQHPQTIQDISEPGATPSGMDAIKAPREGRGPSSRELTLLKNTF